MPRTFDPFQKLNALEFFSFFQPATEATSRMPALDSKGNRPLQMTFEEHLRALVYFHLEEHHSAQHLLQVLECRRECDNVPKMGTKSVPPMNSTAW